MNTVLLHTLEHLARRVQVAAVAVPHNAVRCESEHLSSVGDSFGKSENITKVRRRKCAKQLDKNFVEVLMKDSEYF